MTQSLNLIDSQLHLTPVETPMLCITAEQHMKNIRECKSAEAVKSYLIVRGFVQAMTEIAYEVISHQTAYFRYQSRASGIALWRAGMLKAPPTRKE